MVAQTCLRHYVSILILTDIALTNESGEYYRYHPD
jgi:hypothetical protein